MSVEDFYSIEIEGVSNVIGNYTVEHFIQSYSRQLTTYQLPQDLPKIQTIVNRLVSWYEENIDRIRNSKFVMNKQEHEKSYKVLIKLQDLLDEYKAD